MGEKTVAPAMGMTKPEAQTKVVHRAARERPKAVQEQTNNVAANEEPQTSGQTDTGGRDP